MRLINWKYLFSDAISTVYQKNSISIFENETIMQVLQQLVQALKSPQSHQQAVQILTSNPSLMAAFMEQSKRDRAEDQQDPEHAATSD